MFFTILLVSQVASFNIDKEVADVVDIVTKYPDAFGTVELDAGELKIENKELQDVYETMEDPVFLGETLYTKQGILDKIKQNQGIMEKLEKNHQFVRVTAEGVMTFENLN